MKKKYFIYLLGLLIFASCENHNLNDLDSSVESKSTLGTRSSGNTAFQNIEIKTVGHGGGNDMMSGEITNFGDGQVEYDFSLWTQTTGAIDCVVWTTNGEIKYNGRSYQSIHGVSGQKINFSIRFYSMRAKVFIEANRQAWQNQTASARLVIEKMKHNGEQILGPTPGAFDLNIDARYRDHLGGGSEGEYMWMCNNCGALNSNHRTECILCNEEH